MNSSASLSNDRFLRCTPLYHMYAACLTSAGYARKLGVVVGRLTHIPVWFWRKSSPLANTPAWSGRVFLPIKLFYTFCEHPIFPPVICTLQTTTLKFYSRNTTSAVWRFRIGCSLKNEQRHVHCTVFVFSCLLHSSIFLALRAPVFCAVVVGTSVM